MSSSPRSPRGFFPADLTPLIVSGWQTNKFDGSIAFWEDVDGVQFTSTSIKGKEGRVVIPSGATKPIRGLHVIEEYNTRVWYIGDTASIYKYEENDSFETVGSGYTLVEDTSGSSWDSLIGLATIVSVVNGGTGYNLSTVGNLTFTGGTGSGFIYDPNVTAGSGIQNGYIINNGTGYTVGDVLTENSATDGTGFQVRVESIKSIWDNGDSSWDSFGALKASQWVFTNFGTWVIATDEVGPLRIKKNNVSFGDLLSGSVSGATITSGGSGYSVGDSLSFTGGTGSGFTATVKEVDGSDAVTRFKINNYGSGFIDGETLTANSGGLTVSLQISNCPFTRVKSIDKSGPHILAINYDKVSGTKHPYDVAWCSADNPDDWVLSTTNSAGSLTLREANSELKCIVPLGESKAIYTENQMFILTYTGDPFYFGYQTAMTSGVGAMSPKSVISVDRLNYGLSDAGLFMTDGNSATVLGEEEGINAYIKENLSSSQRELVHALHNKSNNEIVWHIPVESNHTNLEITYNYKTKVFSKRTRDVSATFEAGVFPTITSADSKGNLYFEGLGSDTRNTMAITKAHDLGDPHSIKELTSIRVGKTGITNPKIEIGWANKINDEPTFNLNDTFYADEDYKEYSLRTSGRYLFLRISSEDTADWEISNIVIKGRTRGFR